MADFYEMDFTKGIVILVKADEMYNILKSASNHLLNERWERKDVVNVWAYRQKKSLFSGDMPIRLLRPSFTKGQTSSRKKYSCRERSSYCKIDGTEIR